MDPFEELVGRVKALTGLNARKSSAVAAEFGDDDELPTSAQIVAKARELGFDAPEKPHRPADIGPEIAPEISTDPAAVLAEVYECCPRVLMAKFPQVGKAPSELQANEDVMAQLNELPDDVRALLVKVDLEDGHMTVWLRDEANDVDRPIGPIDLRRYSSGAEMHEAIRVLLGRLPLVLRADTN